MVQYSDAIQNVDPKKQISHKSDPSLVFKWSEHGRLPNCLYFEWTSKFGQTHLFFKWFFTKQLPLLQNLPNTEDQSS